ncbi:MAG: sporulation protein YabP [Sporolactobacillus sp.]|jgi:sporulation protein YabP|nr:sporulation protein YabP [Sporolactobacillus sp.]MCI1880996.1 sporulation protein YabP [Sporolactobacillus sp.]
MSAYRPTPPEREKPAQRHDIVVKNRRTIEITGVKHVESFDHEEFLLETVMGYLAIRGSALKMQNLNVDQGLVAIEGRVIEISYLDDSSGDSHKGFFGKLFR